MIEKLSPNYDARPEAGRIDMLLLHYTGMESMEAALERMCDEEARVSAHYMIDEDGTLYALVSEEYCAWHAGVSSWAGERNINGCSIGIELVNPGHEFGYRDFPEPQMGALITLAQGVIGRHPIPAHRVLGHSDVAPARKEDPGERFDWGRLAREGMGHWIAPVPIEDQGQVYGVGDRGDDIRTLQEAFSRYGYGIEADGVFGQQTLEVVTAFQRHFRPQRVDGVADISTCRTLAALEAALSS